MLNIAWDHNTYYRERLLRALPAHCARVLDVGCGTGEFAVRLSQRADQVDALDRSPAMITAARPTAPANVTCLLGDAATVALPAGSYDAITSISALHHLDLPVLLPRLAAALRPGALLIAVSHHRLDVPWGLPAGRRYRRDMYQRHAAAPAMPVMNPRLTLRQVRAQAAAVLPEARVRWLVHWRYELTWRRPSESGLPRSRRVTR